MDGAIAFLTLGLVVITGYYAWQNRQMVGEMRLAREASARPHLALCFEPLGPMNVIVGLVNLGPGAALSIDLTIVFRCSPVTVPALRHGPTGKDAPVTVLAYRLGVTSRKVSS